MRAARAFGKESIVVRAFARDLIGALHGCGEDIRAVWQLPDFFLDGALHGFGEGIAVGWQMPDTFLDGALHGCGDDVQAVRQISDVFLEGPCTAVVKIFRQCGRY
ncbi:MAG TPA: hypothetical protein PKW82_08890 [Spirochaetales bacterium]|nr:hypothetical protein [Spirochaetales bacterium]